VLQFEREEALEPGTPFLYDLKLTLVRGDQKIDELASYFGLRKVRSTAGES